MSQLQCYQTVFTLPYNHTSKCHNYNVIKQFLHCHAITSANVTITMLSNSFYTATQSHQQMSQLQCYQTVFTLPHNHISKCHNYNVIKQFLHYQITTSANVTITMLSNSFYTATQSHQQMSQLQCYLIVYTQPNMHTSSKNYNHNAVIQQFIRS